MASGFQNQLYLNCMKEQREKMKEKSEKNKEHRVKSKKVKRIEI